MDLTPTDNQKGLYINRDFEKGKLSKFRAKWGEKEKYFQLFSFFFLTGILRHG
jgi:hypothetical protein